MNLLISAVEINDHHGVGIFVRRLFPDSRNFITIRSSSLYGGDNQFGSAGFELGGEFQALKQRATRLREILKGSRIDRILAVPYFTDDFENAYLAKSLTRAPLCAYLMDDQNIFEPCVPNHAVLRLLRAADFRLAVSQEMALAYQEKFGSSFHVLPPVMTRFPAESSPGDVVPATRRAALLGNIWRPEAFKIFRKLVGNSDLRVDWFGKGPQASWLNAHATDLEKGNIFCQGFLPDIVLLERLKQYPFMIVPSGSLGPDDPNVAFSRLSLPSRLIFALVSVQVPILVLGSEETAAGRFVRNLRIGTVAGYDPRDFAKAISYLMDPTNQRILRENGLARASQFVLEEGGEWIWRSLERREPATSQFAEIFPLPRPTMSPLRGLWKFFAGKQCTSLNDKRAQSISSI